MNISLEDLKKNGGAKKEFTYLTPLLDVLKKEYKDIYEKMNYSNINAAMEELYEAGKIPALAYYFSTSEIRLTEAKAWLNTIELKKNEEGAQPTT